ncbi:hypothetical protein LINGRAHAP2_LOCUS14449 [Linum grandiflorum]
MRTQMANLWKPHEGISIFDKGEGLILFRFYHPLDRDLVLEGGPWTFDQHLLLCKLSRPMMISPKFRSTMWIFGSMPMGLQLNFTQRQSGKHWAMHWEDS